jgi:Icc-related predicted phosphoesterase
VNYLLTTDLHGKPSFYDFVLERSAGYDATLMPGDLIDYHDNSISEKAKIRRVLDFALQMEQARRKLILTSGNHDLDDLVLMSSEVDPEPSMALCDHQWMQFPELNGMTHVSSYGKAVELDDMVVLPIRWHQWASCPDKARDALGEAGAEARATADQLGKKLAFLHHEKPECSWVMEECVRKFQPDYFICGHEHTEPFHSGPARKYENTFVINTGQFLYSEEPAHGILDTDKNLLIWHSHETPEAGLTVDLDDLTTEVPQNEITQPGP